MFDEAEDFDSGWGDYRPPVLRRSGVRSVITLFVVVSFLMLTLMSTCSPRTTPITTTTTVPGISALG